MVAGVESLWWLEVAWLCIKAPFFVGSQFWGASKTQ